MHIEYGNALYVHPATFQFWNYIAVVFHSDICIFVVQEYLNILPEIELMIQIILK